MPNTDFRYEEFEGFLGSYALSLEPLRTTGKPEDLRDYKEAMKILKGFAKRHEVQIPERAITNPRTKEDWAKPNTFSNFSMIDMMGSFWRDFGVGYLYEGNKDNQEVKLNASEINHLGRIILGVLERYNVASVEYQAHEEQQIPIRLKKWNKDKEFQKLVDVISG